MPRIPRGQQGGYAYHVINRGNGRTDAEPFSCCSGAGAPNRLSQFMRRYHQHYGGSGHVWQGRFKSFPVKPGEHLITVLRYVLQNPLPATHSALIR